MIADAKNPNALGQAGAVELTETELDQASGGWSWGDAATGGALGIKGTAATQEIADGSVKPFMIDFKWEA